MEGSDLLKVAIKEKFLDAKEFSDKQAHDVMKEIMTGRATPAQVGAFLVALEAKGVSPGEMAAFVTCMREHARVIKPDVGGKRLVDTCGTGGDLLKTVNLSTLGALVAAGAGVTVAKHGNRSVTSTCGSADVLEHVGVDITAAPDTVRRCIEKAGLGFMFAPVFHPAMKHAIGPRREIGLRTVFNILGPLTNPANVKGQVLGVFDPEKAEVMARALLALGVDHFFVVHNEHGADELLPAGQNLVVEGEQGELKKYSLRAGDFGMDEVPVTALQVVQTKDDATKQFIEILVGKGEPAILSAVVMNATLAIIAGGKAPSINDAVALARHSLASGAALASLKALVVESGGNEAAFAAAFNDA